MGEASAIKALETPRDEERFSVHLAMFGRSPEFTRRQWRVFLITITAGFFDNYDGALFSLALKQMSEGLKIAEARLSNMAFFIRLGYLGSFLLTPLADVVGRRRLLLYTIYGYTLFTALTALSPSERAFIVFQVLSRAFAGAEATIALVILVEEVDAGVRGWTIGLLSALSSGGYGIAALAFAFIKRLPYGWRGLYALALIPLVVIIPLRRALPESHRFEESTGSAQRPSNPLEPIAALFEAYPGRFVMLVAVTFFSNMGGNAAVLYLPLYLQNAHGYSPGSVSAFYFLAGVVGVMGSIVIGRLSDRFGRRRMGSLCYLLAPLMTIVVYHSSGIAVIPAWIAELFCDMGSYAIFRAYSAELFPTSHRSTAGSALSIAGTTGGAIGFLIEGLFYRYTHSHWTAISYLTVFWMLAPLIVYFGFPETAGRELEAISPEARAASPAI